MTIVEPGSVQKNLIERVKAILLRPTPTWEVIDAEPATVGGLYKDYACILAAIGPIAALIGGVVFGHQVLGVTWRPPLVGSILGAVVTYGLSLLTTYVLALVIDGLAPTFDGQKSQIQALKVAVYSNTAGWVAGVFMLIPAIGWLGALLGLYGFYLLYRGLPIMMKAPQEKATAYTVVTVIVAVVLFIIVGAIAGAVGGLGAAAGLGAMSDKGHLSGEMKLGNGAAVDLGKLEAASKQMEAAAKQMQDGSGPEPTSPDVLKTMLPAAVIGYTRSELNTGSGGAAGMSGSTAEGVYAKGDQRITLSVVDLGSAGALAAMAGAFNVKSSSEGDGRYEKMGKVDGRMTMEEFDKNTGHGEYSVMVADRFMVQAKGEGASIDELKAAVAAVGPAKLESLAKAG